MYTDGNEEVERDMYATLPYFQSSNDFDGYEKWKNQLEDFFRYFALTEMPLCSNEADWRSLLMVGRQSYQLTRLAVDLTKTSSYSVCSTLREPTIQ